jgi:hypothetical protein
MTEVTISIDPANANAFIPTYWSTVVIDEYISQAVISGLVDRRFEANLKKGDTLSRPSISAVAPIARSANTDLTYNTVVESSVNVVVNQDYYVFRMIEPMTTKQSIVDLISKYTTMDAKSIAKQIDTGVAALFEALNSGTNYGTLNVDVTDDDLLNCVTALDINNVPSENRSWVISPETWASLMKIDKFVRMDYVKPDGQTATERAKMNYPIYGAPVYVSNCLEPNAGNHNCALIQKEAIELVVQQDPKVVKAWDTRRGADALLTEAFWGLVEARDKNGVCLQGK